MKILKNHILFLAAISAVIFSCKKEGQMPLAEDQLVKILCDIHVAEATFDVLNGSKKDTAAVQYYGQIYDIHQVRAADVDTCLAYLKRNPTLAEKIYTKVVEELEKAKLEGMQE